MEIIHYPLSSIDPQTQVWVGYKFIMTRDVVRLAAVRDHTVLGADFIPPLRAENILAAGAVDIDGTVTSWESICYGVKTPEKMRASLLALLQAWFDSPEGEEAVRHDNLFVSG